MVEKIIKEAEAEEIIKEISRMGPVKKAALLALGLEMLATAIMYSGSHQATFPHLIPTDSIQGPVELDVSEFRRKLASYISPVSNAYRILNLDTLQK